MMRKPETVFGGRSQVEPGDMCTWPIHHIATVLERHSCRSARACGGWVRACTGTIWEVTGLEKKEDMKCDQMNVGKKREEGGEGGGVIWAVYVGSDVVWWLG